MTIEQKEDLLKAFCKARFHEAVIDALTNRFKEEVKVYEEMTELERLRRENEALQKIVDCL